MVKELAGEIIEETLWGFVAKLFTGGFKDLFSSAAQKGIETAQDRAKKGEEYRHELAAWINKDLRDADLNAAKNLLRRWSAREQNQKRTYYVGRSKPEYEPGSESFMIHVLGKVFEHLDPENESEENREREEEARLELFKFMGNMEDKEFDSFLVVLHNDTFEQWVVKAWHYVSKFGQEGYRIAKKVAKALQVKMENAIPEPDQVKNAVNAVDSVVATGVRKVNSMADSWLKQRGA